MSARSRAFPWFGPRKSYGVHEQLPHMCVPIIPGALFCKICEQNISEVRIYREERDRDITPKKRKQETARMTKGLMNLINIEPPDGY